MAQPQKATDSAKYDRQLRLWGEEGQSRLEHAKLCLIHATATGTETLKNLVLPGIGSFTIVDDQKVTEGDVGHNFFLLHDSVGASRAVVARDMLIEMNDLVHGEAVDRNPVELIEKEPQFFTQFTVIIANDLPEVPLLKLARICWQHNIALVVERSWGLIGYLRIVTPEHTMIESKPDNPMDDLRLANPFPELAQYAYSFDLDKMDSREHSHTPFIVILLQYLAKWRADHNDKLPSTYAEKSAFKDMVIKGSRKSEEENFSEAYKSAHKAYVPTSIPSGTRAVLEDPRAANPNEKSPKFWILAAALREFVANEGSGLLPLMGSIPDMTATTEGYIALQRIYQEKATKDAEAVHKRVCAILERLGQASDTISFEETKQFCKNANFLQAIRYRSLDDEYNPTTAKTNLIVSSLSDPNPNISWYLALRAAFRFQTKHNRYPGSNDSNVASDVEEMKKEVRVLLDEMGLKDAKVEDKYVEEIVRFGPTELHTTAAFLGGVASQEIIKLVTHQYSPMDNTFLFNGLSSTSLTLSL